MRAVRAAGQWRAAAGNQATRCPHPALRMIVHCNAWTRPRQPHVYAERPLYTSIWDVHDQLSHSKASLRGDPASPLSDPAAANASVMPSLWRSLHGRARQDMTQQRVACSGLAPVHYLTNALDRLTHTGHPPAFVCRCCPGFRGPSTPIAPAHGPFAAPRRHRTGPPQMTSSLWPRRTAAGAAPPRRQQLDRCCCGQLDRQHPQEPPSGGQKAVPLHVLAGVKI
jgi:hypothetical protein